MHKWGRSRYAVAGLWCALAFAADARASTGYWRRCAQRLGLDRPATFQITTAKNGTVQVVADTQNPLLATIPPLARLFQVPLGISEMTRIYYHARRDPRPLSFPRRVLDAMHVTPELPSGRRAWIPSTGPVLFLSNHPLSGVEAFALLEAVAPVRTDVKVVMNDMLAGVAELREFGIFADPFRIGTAGNGSNLRAAGQIIRTLRSGNCVVMYPAAQVSDVPTIPGGVYVDNEWNPGFMQLLARTNATVVPVFTHGEPSSVFQRARTLHPISGTLLLPREMTGLRGYRIPLTLGQGIAPDEWRAIPEEERTQWFRARVYALSGSHENARLGAGANRRPERPPAPPEHEGMKIIDAVAKELLAADVAALPAANTLFETDDVRIVHAKAEQIPNVLREIGRLREVSFRGVGEGSKLPLDLDAFDEHYRHLFVWMKKDQAVLGAYRLGLVDELVAKNGPAGVYNSAFYDLSRFFERYGAQTLDLGRSFVAPSYQRTPRALFWLFQGVSLFAAHHPQYRYLMGSVSMSRTFHETSRQLVVEYLRAHHFDAAMAAYVRPYQEPQFQTPLSAAEAALLARHMPAADFTPLVNLVRAIEPPSEPGRANGKNPPVLIPQYAKLAGKFLGFIEDRQFNTVDGLVVVDLTKTAPKELGKFMGAEVLAEYLAKQK